MTGGKYFRARTRRSSRRSTRCSMSSQPAESDERGFRPVNELFYWPLAAALVIALDRPHLQAFGRV